MPAALTSEGRRAAGRMQSCGQAPCCVQAARACRTSGEQLNTYTLLPSCADRSLVVSVLPVPRARQNGERASAGCNHDLRSKAQQCACTQRTHCWGLRTCGTGGRRAQAQPAGLGRGDVDAVRQRRDNQARPVAQVFVAIGERRVADLDPGDEEGRGGGSCQAAPHSLPFYAQGCWLHGAKVAATAAAPTCSRQGSGPSTSAAGTSTGSSQSSSRPHPQCWPPCRDCARRL